MNKTDHVGILPVLKFMLEPARSGVKLVEHELQINETLGQPVINECFSLVAKSIDDFEQFAGAKSVLTPASDGSGTWKWDLMNTLQVLEETKAEAPQRHYKYCRIGFIPKHLQAGLVGAARYIP